MLRRPGILLFILLFIIACKDNDERKDNTKRSPGIEGCWYKRYTGTVAGQQVVANLSFHKSGGEESSVTIGGNYYYRGKSGLIDLSEKDRSDSTIHFTESVATEREDEEHNSGAEWFVTINESGVKGRWKSADGKKTYEVDLTESYEEGSYAFDVMSRKDSVFMKPRNERYSFFIEYNLLVPSAKMNKGDAAFIEAALMHELGGDTIGAKNFEAFIKASNKKDFEEYKARVKAVTADSDAVVSEQNNWEYNMNSYIEYNDNGLVVFNFSMYEYSGGAHPNGWSRYVCMDVRERKVLKLNDVMNVDTLRLNALLDIEARRTFKVKDGAPLSSEILADTIPPTDNIIISDKGLYFHYNPYEVTPYVMGDVFFYLSYLQLGDMLKPGFKKRMKL